MGYIGLSLPAPTSWLTVYRDLHAGKVGVSVLLAEHLGGVRDAVKDELGGRADVGKVRDGRTTVTASLPVGPLYQVEVRERAFAWLVERVNTFVNVMRPRMRSAAADNQSRRDQGRATIARSPPVFAVQHNAEIRSVAGRDLAGAGRYRAGRGRREDGEGRPFSLAVMCGPLSMQSVLNTGGYLHSPCRSTITIGGIVLSYGLGPACGARSRTPSGCSAG
jgi:hypothetical protein